MKKILSRFLGLVLAVTLIVGTLAVTAFADEIQIVETEISASEEISDDTVTELEVVTEDAVYETETTAAFEEKAEEADAVSDQEINEADSNQNVDETTAEEQTDEEPEEAVSEEQTEEPEEAVSEEKTEEETTEPEETEKASESKNEKADVNNKAVTEDEKSEEDAELSALSDLTWNGWKYTVSSGTATVTGYSYTTSTLTIPSSVNGYTVTGIGSSAFKDGSYTTITIPETITSIGNSAFKNCYNVTQINFNAKSCSNVSSGIYNNPFYGIGKTSKSVSVVFGTNVKRIPGNLFNTGADYDSGNGSYAYVTSVSMSSKVTEIGNNAFDGCYDLKSVKMSDALTTIGSSAFYDCALTTITIPENVTSIGNCAFYNCYNLTKIYFNAKACNGVSSGTYYNPFYGAGKTSKSVSVVFGDNVTLIPSNLFNTGANYDYGNGSYAYVTSVSMSSKVKTIGNNAFDGCYDLKSVKMSDALTTIGGSAFYDCGITSIKIPEKVTSIGDCAFRNCNNLKKIYFNAKACNNVSSGQYYNPFIGIGKTSGTVAVVFGANVTRIPQNLFNTGENYESGNGDYAHVTSVSMSSKVTIIGNNAFDGCYDLKSVTLSDALTTIGSSAFYDCGLTTITIPENVTSIGNCAFYNCNNLKKIYFNAKSCSDVGSGQYYNPFYGAGKNQTSLYVSFGSKVKRIPANLFNTGVSYSAGNESYAHVTSVSIPASVTYIGVCAFDYCHDMVKFVIKSKTAEFKDSYFKGANSKLTFYCYKGSTASVFASKNGYKRSFLTIYYTITYNLNGGTNNSKNVSKFTGKTAVKLYSPTKKGYTFLGWYTSTSYKTKVTKIPKGYTKNVKLYAAWKQNTYKIAFNSNGGKGTMSTLTCKYATYKTLTKNTFKRTGYTFVGWNTKKDGSGKSYTNAQKVRKLATSGTVTLYAQWKKK